MGRGGFELENAADAKNASDLMQAHLIETLSAVGREYLDFYFLRVRSPLEEFQVDGALEALEMARQEGHIRFIGLSSEGQSHLPALGLWQFHDAFDTVLLTPSQESLAKLAQERRVGVVWRHSSTGPELESSLAELQATGDPAPVLLSVDAPEQVQVFRRRFLSSPQLRVNHV
jgi:aryl-alcohol dehydrogenase-like predicted oxidoreductase